MNIQIYVSNVLVQYMINYCADSAVIIEIVCMYIVN